MLEVTNLDAGYGFLQVVWNVNIQVKPGEFVALVGPNGAGKSTTLKTIAGLVPVRSGSITFDGRPIAGMPAHQISQMGLSFVSESLNLFTNMSVYENLLLGAYHVHDRAQQEESVRFVFDLFPRLQGRRNQLAGTLSGGERKMLAIGRGIMSSPRMLLVDEPSLGLAPKLTLDVFAPWKLAGRRHRPARRAEREHHAAHHRPRLRAGTGPHRARRAEQRAAAERPRAQSLPGYLRS